MLTYLHSLTLMLEPSDLVNSSDVRLAVSRIVTWTTEPKSVEVRKVVAVSARLKCRLTVKLSCAECYCAY